jgi:hypothetical protein
VWHEKGDLMLKPRIERDALDIDGTCEKPLENGDGMLQAVGEKLLERLEGLETMIHET